MSRVVATRIVFDGVGYITFDGPPLFVEADNLGILVHGIYAPPGEGTRYEFLSIEKGRDFDMPDNMTFLGVVRRTFGIVSWTHYVFYRGVE